MRQTIHGLLVICICLGLTGLVHGEEARELDSDAMISELNKRIELSREQWEKLKPVLDEKSRDLKKSIHESVDKGFVQLEEMSRELDSVSKETEAKVKAFLNSEEVQQLKEYLSTVDEEAIQEAKEQIVAELSAVLELTGEQIEKLKPVIEDSVNQLTTMVEELAKEGSRSWEEFKRRYEQLSKELHQKVEETLDDGQLEKLDQYNEEKREKIHQALFSA